MNKYINSNGETTDTMDFIQIDSTVNGVEAYYNVTVFDQHNVILGEKEFSETPTDNQIIFSIKSFKNGDHARIDKLYYIA